MKTPARSALRWFLALTAATAFFLIPLSADQFLSDSEEARKGALAAPASESAPTVDPASTPAPVQPAHVSDEKPGKPEQEIEAPATTPEAASVASSTDFSAFIAALGAAERANEKLAQRLAQMEATVAAQRDRDQLFMRDMIKGVLLLAAGMAAVGLLALVAIVFLQIRATKQQALTFASQWQALANHAALPPPPAAPVAAFQAVQNQFESTAHRLEQKLSDLESLASGLPASDGPHDAGADIPGVAETSSPTTAPRKQTSQARNARDLLSKANSLLQQQQPEVALTYLDQAIINDPHDSQAYLKKGAALERLNRLTDALSAYDGALEADPALSSALLAKAGVLNKLQRYGEALKCYEEALAHQDGQGTKESPAA